VKPFDNLFGDLTGSTGLSEEDFRRIARRAERRARYGRQPAGVAGIRARGAERAALAQEIGAALQMNDTLTARDLIEEAARLGYSHADMLAAVELQARQAQEDRMAAMDGDRWADDRGPIL
jgi:hypothetical protein